MLRLRPGERTGFDPGSIGVQEVAGRNFPGRGCDVVPVLPAVDGAHDEAVPVEIVVDGRPPRGSRRGSELLQDGAVTGECGRCRAGALRSC